MPQLIHHRTMAGIRSPLTSIARSVIGQGRMRSFSGILDQVEGAVFAIAPYLQLSRAQTQSIEVRETGGDTEEVFGPESQAAIEAFVDQVRITYNPDFSTGLNGMIGNTTAVSAIAEDGDGAGVPPFDGLKAVSSSGLDRHRYQFPLSALPHSGEYLYEITLFIPEGNIFVGKSIQNVTGSITYTDKNVNAFQAGLFTYTGKITYVEGGFRFFGDQAVGGFDGATSYMQSCKITALTADGRIATAYNQGSEAADAVQDTADNQPFIATEGVLETGMRFDGSSTTLSIANFTPTVNATLAAWVKPAAATNVGYVMAVGNPATTGQNRLNLNWVGSSDTVRYAAPGENIDSDAVFGGTDWTFVVVTVSGKNLSFFKNAVAAGTGTLENDPLLTDETLRVGSREGAGYFNGLIDAPAIWNRVLTADEITKVYNATDPR